MKHYRRFFEDELENNKEIFTRNPFLNIPISKVKLNNKSSGGLLGSLFGINKAQDDLSSAETVQVGFFKGMVTVSDDDFKMEQELEATLLFQQVLKYLMDAH
jgi:hypothetical protein